MAETEVNNTRGLEPSGPVLQAREEPHPLLIYSGNHPSPEETTEEATAEPLRHQSTREPKERSAGKKRKVEEQQEEEEESPDPRKRQRINSAAHVVAATVAGTISPLSIPLPTVASHFGMGAPAADSLIPGPPSPDCPAACSPPSASSSVPRTNTTTAPPDDSSPAHNTRSKQRKKMSLATYIARKARSSP